MSMVLVEGVIEVTVDPGKLRYNTQEERHLRVIIRFVVKTSTYWVQGLVNVRVDYLVTPVIVGFLPIILWEV
jgi:hypothetical protein